jgi:uncharacterized protein YegJ (DUF2314 family)
VGIAALGGCRRRSAPPSPEPAQRAPESLTTAPSASAAALGASDGGLLPDLRGSLASEHRSIELAIYAPAPLTASQTQLAADTVKKRFAGLPLYSAPTDAAPPYALVTTPPIAQLPPPDEEGLSYVGRGLGPEQAKAAAASKGALVMTWFLAGDPGHASLREAQTVALEQAKRLGGFVWDETTRQMFSLDTWQKERIDGWDGDLPDVRQHVNIHYYATDGGRHRAITLGMEKLGLPDLVLSDVPLLQSERMATVIDAVAQVLVEGALLQPGGVLELDLRAIRHAAAHDAIIGRSGPRATLRGRVELVPVEGEEGDPDNRLAELRFPGYPGASAAERQGAAFAAILGSVPDSTSGARADDPELAAATARAQARLPAIAAAFRTGLPLGERIVVKAPFDTDDGSIEWMWVGVTAWSGDVVTGNLENDPERVRGLRLGAKVQVKQRSIADYMWLRADGSRKEGGESADIFLRREGNGSR